MKKFRHIETGAILVPNSKMVIEQLAKSEFYEEVGASASTDKEMTKKEILAILEEKGIECNDKMTKAELLALIPTEENEDE